MRKIARIFFIWKAGKLHLAYRMKRWNEYVSFYFSYYGKNPTSVKQVENFFKQRVQDVLKANLKL